MKNTISVMNSLGGINSRSDEVENQIINLDDKVEENSQKGKEKEKRLKRTRG